MATSPVGILALLEKRRADLDLDDDYAHMRKVVGYVRRGHDPLKGRS